MKTFSVLASLARAANPWLSKATCPCKSILRYCGCVTLPPIHIDVLTQSHMYRTPESLLAVSACMVAMLSSIFTVWSCLWTSCNAASVAHGNAGVLVFSSYSSEHG